MNSHIYNLQERTECNKVEPKLRLWVINYEVNNTAKGVAVVKAKNAKEASDILLADSQFNSMRNVLDIIRIEEIITYGAYAALVCEEYVEYNSIDNSTPDTNNPDTNISVSNGQLIISGAYDNGTLILNYGKVSNKILIL